MKEYRPILSPIPGTNAMHADYGPAHVERQADAEAVLDAIRDQSTGLLAASRVVLKVYCGGRELGRVYRSMEDGDLDLIVTVAAPRQSPPDLQRINAELGRQGNDRITYAARPFFDPLRAPDDRDLEVSCKCGMHVLDRRKILERIALGEHEVGVASVLFGD